MFSSEILHVNKLFSYSEFNLKSERGENSGFYT